MVHVPESRDMTSRCSRMRNVSVYPTIGKYKYMTVEPSARIERQAASDFLSCQIIVDRGCPQRR